MRILPCVRLGGVGTMTRAALSLYSRCTENSVWPAVTFDPFLDFTDLLMLAQRIQVTGEVGVVVAQDTHPILRKSAKLRGQPSPTGVTPPHSGR